MSNSKQTTTRTISNAELLRRLGVLVWPFRVKLVIAILAMSVLALTNGAIAMMVQPILDNIFIKQDKSMLAIIPLFILGIFAGRGAFYYIQEYFLEYIGLSVSRKLQADMYKHLLIQDIGYLQSFSTGNFVSRVLNDANMVKAAASDILSGIFMEGLSVVVLVGVLFYQDWELAAVSIIAFPLSGYLIYTFGSRVRRLSKRHQELMQGVTTQVLQSFEGMRIVKAFGMEAYEGSTFITLTTRVLHNSYRTARVRAATGPSMDLMAGIAISLVILYGGDLVISGKTTTGSFFSFITAMMLAYNPVKRLAGLNNALQKSLSAALRIFDIQNIKPTIVDAPDAVQIPPIQESLIFDNVIFSYKENLPNVLRGINLQIKAGERVAIVGRSGSGKSSLVNLVPRFFDVTGGSITIDGVDIRQATLESLRKQVAMVTQEVFLFNDTVTSNIAYGDPDPDMEKVRNAANMANATEFINELPDGFNTIIGDRGLRLSGGQRQRLSIARSLYKNAPILVLDEATSSLDTESELAVQEALERLMTGRTTLVIAHRLSTIRNAHVIVVLKDGQIIETGSHENLIALNGEYARLHALQFQYES